MAPPWFVGRRISKLATIVIICAHIKKGGDVRMAELAVPVSRPSAASGAFV
jgi:hypothetical protein